MCQIYKMMNDINIETTTFIQSKHSIEKQTPTIKNEFH